MSYFNHLEKTLVSVPILIYSNFAELFVLTKNASAFAVGSVRSQGSLSNDLHIAYASRTLGAAETIYSTIDSELLAVVLAVKIARLYLFKRKFTLTIDH